MVSPTCYSSTDIRRYSNRGVPSYVAPSPYTERRINAYPHHDLRGGRMAEREIHEEPSSQRKRIAVACLRCRKRKIRCTGDNGTGQPCLNCKNAGFEPCQFLRVASTEAPMKNDAFSYNLDVSRHFQARGSTMVPSGPSPMASYNETLSMPNSEALSYRNGSAYAYNGRPMYSVSGWSPGYAEDGIDYSMYQTSAPPHGSQHQHQQPAYQTVSEAGYMMNYRVTPSPVQAAKQHSGGLYLEPDASYSYSATPTTTGLLHRSGSSTADSGNYAYQSVTAGLSASLASNDRVLPTPTPRPLSTTGQHPYRAESISSGYSKTSQSSNGGSSPAPFPEAIGSYNSYESSPMPTSYPSLPLSSQGSRQSEIYTTSAPLRAESSLGPSEDPLRSTGTELTYKYHDTTSQYRSTYHDNLNLGASGQAYLPQSHGHGTSYMVAGDISADAGASERKPDLHAMRP